MRSVVLILMLVLAVHAGGLERKQAELDSLKQELEYSRKVAQYDSRYQSKVFIDSVKVVTAQNQLAEDVRDSMEPNHGWVWFTVCIGFSATVLTIITIADNAAATE